MINQEELNQVEEFLRSGQRLKAEDKPIHYELPRPKYRGGLAFVMIEYRKPIALFIAKHRDSEDVWYRDVMWSPTKLRRYVLNQLGYERRCGFWERLAIRRRYAVNRWWDSKWAVMG